MTHDIKNYWDDLWSKRKPELYTGCKPEVHALLAKFLPKDPTLKLLEIGCIPANWIVYFSKEFGYQGYGIDYSDHIELARETCRINNIKATIWHEDIFKARLPIYFDIVFSSGFIEHFSNWQDALEGHIRWLKPGGYLVVAVPNIRGIHKALLKTFNPESYSTHYLEIINKPEKLRNYLSDRFHISYFGYWVTFRPFYPLPKIISFFSRILIKLLKILKIYNIPNLYFSPYLWIIAKKNA